MKLKLIKHFRKKKFEMSIEYLIPSIGIKLKFRLLEIKYKVASILHHSYRIRSLFQMNSKGIIFDFIS